jgi:topoisomerase-4 subunit A
VDHAVDYFKELKKKYGAGPRAQDRAAHLRHHRGHQVAVANRKLYVDREEGFMGWSLRGFEFVDECSEIDDIIVFRDNGTMLVTKVADKKFIGKGVPARRCVEEERRAHHLPPGVPGRLPRARAT